MKIFEVSVDKNDGDVPAGFGKNRVPHNPRRAARSGHARRGRFSGTLSLDSFWKTIDG